MIFALLTCIDQLHQKTIDFQFQIMLQTRYVMFILETTQSILQVIGNQTVLISLFEPTGQIVASLGNLSLSHRTSNTHRSWI
jgi:hypothetical protein